MMNGKRSVDLDVVVPPREVFLPVFPCISTTVSKGSTGKRVHFRKKEG